MRMQRWKGEDDLIMIPTLSSKRLGWHSRHGCRCHKFDELLPLGLCRKIDAGHEYDHTLTNLICRPNLSPRSRPMLSSTCSPTTKLTTRSNASNTQMPYLTMVLPSRTRTARPQTLPYSRLYFTDLCYNSQDLKMSRRNSGRSECSRSSGSWEMQSCQNHMTRAH